MAKTAAERQRERRARLRKDNSKQLSITLGYKALLKLEQLCATFNCGYSEGLPRLVVNSLWPIEKSDYKAVRARLKVEQQKVKSKILENEIYLKQLE